MANITESGEPAVGPAPDGEEPESGRRDFLYLATGAMAAVGTAAVAWPFIDSLNPAADTLALATIEVDVSGIEPGQAITVTWRGKPVFIRRRTPEEIEAARATPVSDLPDPEEDAARVIEEDLLVVVGICTHLGCVPIGQRPTDARGDFGGWFCPCHGSHYDTSGRIRRGPAPTNLEVPAYEFVEEQRILIG